MDSRALHQVRIFDVVAFSIPITYDKAGEHDPEGMLYALKEDESLIKSLVQVDPFRPWPQIQPLVLRANVGDQVVIRFKNKLLFPASIHIQGINYKVDESDGSAVGFNKNTVAPPLGTVTYRWHAEQEGIYIFNDLGNPVSDETGSNVHGLWGALIVEPEGATWTDPIAGLPLKRGLYADIHHPTLPDFREYVVFFHDELEILTKDGQKPVDPMTGRFSPTTGISYRSEPMRIRMGGGSCVGEECHMSSWPYGDPATPVLRAYVGDPMKIRLVHGGIKETHVFHLHLYQWRLDPKDPDSTIIDSISIGPQQVYNIEPLYGAGSLQGAKGDAIWHCHLYPHFMDGMWGLLRSLDRLEDGTRTYPDGAPIPALQPLPDRPMPLPPTPTHPGYPLFIPGTAGQKAPEPPLGIVGGRVPTPLETANFDPDPVPGAAFVNPCPPGVPVKQYELSAIQLPIIYNGQGWHDPEGRIFVLAEDEAAVLSGAKEPEPLVIRANSGDCIEITFTNKLPPTIGGNAFQLLQATIECGNHIHLVKFDPLCSDGATNGWNYNSSAGIMETIRFRWYADEELRTVFFHDHMFPNSHQQHGLFAVLIVEPEGSTYHDPETGSEIRAGTKAVIRNPNLPDFREFVLAFHDFALLFDKDGQPLNPPPYPNSQEDPGVMGINYRSEPFQFRPGDPAYVFSSFVHGDPVTPLLEAYQGDPVRIRLFDGAQEEQHCFVLHGHRWRKEPTDPNSPLVSSQTIGLSEAFNFEFNATELGDGDQDFLYYSGGIDDLWLGMWGIMRVYKEAVEHLLPLEDRPAPPPRITPLPAKTGLPPAPASGPGTPWPPGTSVRRYEIAAIQKDIVYNKFGDHDPDGLLFVLKEDEAAVISGCKQPEPLIIRAAAGEGIEICLTNHLPLVLPPTVHPEVPVEAPWPPSNRASIHAQCVRYDALGSDGAVVGFNPDQSVPPGDTITYRWYADLELGIVALFGFADLRNHRHRGLFGALVIEPAGTNFYDHNTGQPIKAGAQTLIKDGPGTCEFHEFVVIGHTGIDLFDCEGNRIPDPFDIEAGAGEADEEEDADFEDQGQKAFNYRCERFANRLKNHPTRSLVFSSLVHGDPSTPVFVARAGQRTIFRYLMAGDKPRNTTFGMHGHSWLSQPDDPESNVINMQGAVSVANAFNIELIGGAGGPNGRTGDFMYRSGIIRWDLEQGMWGILRVKPAVPGPGYCRHLWIAYPYMRGEDVLAVQKALLKCGFNPGPLDGIYGPKTEAAVKAFQSFHGLTPDGVVDGEEYQALQVDCPTGQPPPYPVYHPNQCRELSVTSPYMTGQDVSAVQNALGDRGIDPGPVDGIYGPKTANGVRAYQQREGLPVDGIFKLGMYPMLNIVCP
ncbi:MAG: peptidoglycan-binding protein [Firmicutes bacterium]|nr:peptidoglycan-binding protein [Bacillota bacterium]